MATEDQVTEVRENTNEPTSATWTDAEIVVLVDAFDGSVNLASAAIWKKKAARYADLVNTTEAGARRDLSDLYDRAVKQAAFWQGEEDALTPEPDSGRAKVHVINRTL